MVQKFDSEGTKICDLATLGTRVCPEIIVQVDLLNASSQMVTQNFVQFKITVYSECDSLNQQFISQKSSLLQNIWSFPHKSTILQGYQLREPEVSVTLPVIVW